MAFVSTVVYSAEAFARPLVQMVSQIAAVPLFEGELEQLGFDVTGDSSAIAGFSVERTIELTTNALGDTLWTTAEQAAAATRKLYTQQLERRLPAVVSASEPVIT